MGEAAAQSRVAAVHPPAPCPQVSHHVLSLCSLSPSTTASTTASPSTTASTSTASPSSTTSPSAAAYPSTDDRRRAIDKTFAYNGVSVQGGKAPPAADGDNKKKGWLGLSTKWKLGTFWNEVPERPQPADELDALLLACHMML